MKNFLSIVFLVLSGAVAFAQQQPTANTNNHPTVDIVMKKQKVTCMINADGIGLAWVGPDNKYQGFEIDICKALAAATLGDSEKYMPLPTIAKDQMVTLLSLNADVAVRNFARTAYREATLPVIFTNNFLYDTQAFAVKKKSNIKKIEDLNGVTVCIQQGNLTELGTATWFRKHNMKFTQVTFGDPNTNLSAFKTDRCDVFTLDRIMLAAEMKRGGIEDYEILPFEISRTFYGVMVRQDDTKWAGWVKAVVDALAWAEEFGITKDNVEEMKAKSTDPNVRKLLGVEGDFHTKIGLDSDWAVRAIKAVGNYGEIYDRWILKYTNTPRGKNNLCSNGGYVCPVPF